MSEAGDELGITIGRYRLIRRLGQGGMGVVYLAEHEALRRPVVVKMLRPELSRDRGQVDRFFNEARAAARLAHPGIVDVLDVGTEGADGPAYFVMEYLDGESLGARLGRDRSRAPELAIAVIRQAALAVQAAHAHGIVHRDLKPDNLFLVPDPEIAIGLRVKVLDFGLAKLLDEALAAGVRTRTGELMGTPLYMAPEQCKGAETVDHRADVYALGCILYEMVCGRPPFVARGLGEMLIAHQTEPVPPPRSLAPAIAPPLEQVIVHALAKRPWERQQSCQQLADELGALGLTTSTQRPAPVAAAVAVARSGDGDATLATGLAATLGSGGTTGPIGTSTQIRGESVVAPTSGDRARRWWWIAGAAVAVVAAVATAIAVWPRAREARPPVAPVSANDPPARSTVTPEELDAGCQRGDGAACRDLGLYLHRVGRNQEAVAAHQRGCELQTWRSCALLATLLRRGAGTMRDAARAVVLDRSACDHDDATGCTGLGQALLAGDGVAFDAAAGRTALERACTLQAAIGCAALAAAVDRGIGGPPDPARARELYQRACKAGDRDGCAGLP